MDIAIQITPTGLTYALKPVDDQATIVAMYVRWPSYGNLRYPRSTPAQQSALANKLVLRLISNSAAQTALLAIEEGTSEHRIAATKSAFEQEHCIVTPQPAHPDGALGLMRDWLGRDAGQDENQHQHHRKSP